ncbi:hypothetical protein MMC25_003640 [Agyrium rufum]|nr:hypothetical protein [Agyrium rufum]
MYHSGIGGGGFALVRASNGSYESVDFREAAPAAAFESMYQGNEQGSIVGGLASAVPGDARGLEYIHNNYGVLEWKNVVLPAVNVARYGFPVSEDFVRFASFMTAAYGDFLTKDPNWALDFAPNGTRVGLGDILTRKRYANTLETIAFEGADAFYTGAIARNTVAALQLSNGSMNLKDLEDYKVISRKPVEIEYRGYRILGCGVPASGAVALSMFKTVEGYEDFGKDDAMNISTHRLDEAMRFAYAERASMGDPDFVSGMAEHETDMLTEKSSAATRGKISDYHTLNVSDYDPSGFEILDSHGTSHIVAADASGMAITLTSTINLIFGNRVMVPETGVIMNDEMNDFSIPRKRNEFGYYPSPANYIRPGKRPMSSVTPTIVEHASNHSLYYVIGAAGGSRIITATVLNLWNVLDRKMNTHDALAEPRFHDQLLPNQVGFEYTFDNSTIEFMKSRQHNVTWVPPFFSSAQGLRILPDGGFEAAGEPRQKASAGLTT